MKERGLHPTSQSYHILIRECVDNNLLDEALQYFNDCIEIEKLVPERVSFNVLMNACRKQNRPQDVLMLRSLMRLFSIKINDSTVKFTIIAEVVLEVSTTKIEILLEILLQLCSRRSVIVCYRVVIESPIESLIESHLRTFANFFRIWREL
jgi:pentatricopeptide repeat protein